MWIGWIRAAATGSALPNRSLGLPLRCGLEVAARLGAIAKPLEPLIRAELEHGQAELAARALDAMGNFTDATTAALARVLGRDVLVAAEAAYALVRCGKDNADIVLMMELDCPAVRRALKMARDRAQKG